MSYLVLARKFRPQSFSAIRGQEHIWRGLANAIIRNRVPHALLLTGPRGVGKTSTARVLAKALNCQQRPESNELAQLPEDEALLRVEPCNECANCKEIAKGSSLSVWEIDGASNNSVDNVRELIESLHSLPPATSRFKIYIVDEVHMLSVAAFNALLKSLEEPPPNTVFIFATTEPHRLPETVISRCQRHDFRRLTTSTVIEQLRDITATEGVVIDDAVLALIARKSNGGMRDAQSMLDRLMGFSSNELTLSLAERVLGFIDRSTFFRIGSCVLNQDAPASFQALREIFEQSVELRSFLADFVLFWRNLLFVSLFEGAKGKGSEAELLEALELTSAEIVEYRQLLQTTNSFDAGRLFDTASKLAEQALGSHYPRYVLEAGLARMCALPSLRPIADIISSLESGVAPSNSAAKERTIPRKAEPAAPTWPASVDPVPAASSTSSVSAGTIPKAAPRTAAPLADLTWPNFIAAVKQCRHQLLSELLRRVSARRFGDGVLEIEGAAFDISALQDSDNQAKLQECLVTASGRRGWQLKFVEIQPGEVTRAAARPNTPVSQFTPGSIADQEERAKAEREKGIDLEARSNPAVKAALSTFSGSRIEKVSVIKE